MTREELLASLRTWFQKYRSTTWFRITYLVLLGVIVAELYVLTLSPVACLVLFLMPLSVFVVPYWLGERKLRRFAGNALVVFLIAIVLASAMSTQALLVQKEAVPLRSVPASSNSPIALSNGTVKPYQAPPPASFTFRVKLTTIGNGTPDAYRVYTNVTIVHGLGGFDQEPHRMTFLPGIDSSNNTKAGSWFETNVTLGDSIYGYAFSAWDQDSNWTFAGPDFGPVTASGWTFYGFFLYVTALSQVTILAVITYFAILFLWWYTIRARQARAKAIGVAAQPTKEPPTESSTASAKPTPSSGGSKAAKAAAFTCTNCGADVDETDAKCPKCGAVFED